MLENTNGIIDIEKEVKATLKSFLNYFTQYFESMINQARKFSDQHTAEGINKKYSELNNAVSTSLQATGEGADGLGGKGIGGLVGGLAGLLSAFAINSQAEGENEKISQATKLISQIEICGGQDYIRDLLKNYLGNRFIEIIIELEGNETAMKELAEMFASAAIGMLIEMAGSHYKNQKLDKYFLQEHLFPVDHPAFEKGIFQKKLSHNNSNGHDWTYEAIVRRSPVCTLTGELYVRADIANSKSKNDRQDKYPAQRMTVQEAEKLGYINSRINFKGESVNNNTTTNINENITNYLARLTSFHLEIKELRLSKKIKNIHDAKDGQRKERKKLWKKLSECKGTDGNSVLKNSAEEIRKIILEYSDFLWFTTYVKCVEKNKLFDQVQASWFQNEVNWLQKLVMEAKSFWKPTLVEEVNKIVEHLSLLAKYTFSFAKPLEETKSHAEIFPLMQNNNDLINDNSIDLQKIATENSEGEADPAKHLLKTSVIKKLSPYNKKQIMAYIEGKNKAGLLNLASIVSNEGIKEIERELKIIDSDYNLRTLVDEIIKYEKDDSLIQFIGENENFFKGKELCLSSSDGFQSEIISFTRNSNQLVFKLKNHAIITVVKNIADSIINVMIVRQSDYKFNQYLTNIATEESVQIELEKNDRINNNSFKLMPGKYTLKKEETGQSNINTIQSMVNNVIKVITGNYTHWSLTKSDPAVRYDIYIYKQQNIAQIKHDGQIYSIPIYDLINYSVLLTQQPEYLKIDPDLDKKIIRIREKSVNQSDIRYNILTEVDKIKEDIITLLIREENKKNLDSLLDHFIQHQSSLFNSELLQNILSEDLKGMLKDIVNLYSQIEVQCTMDEILAQMIFHANYERFIKKDNNLPLLKTMELLTEAIKNINYINGKDLILVLGTTGAGKSVSTNYFSGVNMEEVVSKSGEKIVRVNDQSLDPKTYATIGESKNISQTAYVEGYSIRDAEEIEKKFQELQKSQQVKKTLGLKTIMLCDFPGFDDTRGEHYDFCTFLSIRKTIEEANTIRAVMLVIPYNAFFLDKGNSVISAFKDLLAIMPGALENQNSLFLIITQYPDYPNVINNFKKDIHGYFLKEEAQLQEQKKKGATDSELDTMKGRTSVWKTLDKMCSNDQVEFISVENLKRRKELIQKYVRAPIISKKAFDQKKEDDIGIQLKFITDIKVALDTWQEHVMEHYLVELPEKIIKFKATIREYEKAIEQEQSGISSAQKYIEETETQKKLKIADKNACQEIIEKGDFSEMNVSIEQLREKIDENKNEERKLLEEELENCEKEIASLGKNIRLNQIKNADIDREIVEIEEEIAKLEKKIRDDKKGTTNIPLEEVNKEYKPNELLYLTTYQSGVFEESVREVKELDKSKVISSLISNTNDYRGVLNHYIHLSREYRLVPEDEVERETFLKLASPNSVDKYRAFLGGKHCKLKDSNVDPTGKTVVYWIQSTWEGNGNNLPVLEIIVTIPNIEAKAGNIRNNDGTINSLRGRIAERTATKELLSRDLNGFNADLVSATSKKNNLKQAIENAKSEALNLEVKQLLLRLESEIPKLDKKIAGYQQEIAQKNNKIEENRVIIQGEEEKLLVVTKEKSYFAILIQKQKHILECLRHFAGVLGSSNQNNNNNQLNLNEKISTDLPEQCRKFIEYYDKHIEQLEAECKKDLQLPDISSAQNASSKTAPNAAFFSPPVPPKDEQNKSEKVPEHGKATQF